MRRLVWLAPMLSLAVVSAQTRITPPDNKYTLEEDVQLGREAAEQVEDELPILHDDAVSSYIETLGDRLVAAIPAELRHPEFHYTFAVVNVRDINAFALPGGPMFVNRGMIAAAQSEGEVAGVMAHEISHVALRHGTAQAGKAQKYALGQFAGQVLGAIIGGNVGSIVAQGTQFGIGTYFLRFSREYEKQADLLGARIMARAGYDPLDMARMFQTIEKQGGAGGPQWLSDHPNPGNRVAYITEEARTLRVDHPVTDMRAFERVQAHLKTLPRAPTTEQAMKDAPSGRRPGGAREPSGVLTDTVEAPSTRVTTYEEGNLYRVSVPSNWRELRRGSSVTFAPAGGFGEHDGSSVFTHGVEIGVTREASRDLEQATNDLFEALQGSNPRMRREGASRPTAVDGRSGLAQTLSNVSEATGKEETIQLVTTQLDDGRLLYAIAVAPSDEFDGYRSAFDRVMASIRLTG
ncbi:MAG: M48 family metalloprotease [Acidobacteria bacterium]|nr:M48 family metalloprotease [Acidobacteriota bacterium]